jgi:hypothetical protein
MPETGPQTGPQTGPETGGGDLPLIAYRLQPDPRLRLAAAPVRRDWMDATDQRFATRCLPLLMANQAGWLCMIVPQRRGELERFRPSVADLAEMPDTRDYLGWRQRREGFLQELSVPDSAAAKAGWQRDYMTGTVPDGGVFAGHQRRLRLREWAAAPARRLRCG